MILKRLHQWLRYTQPSKYLALCAALRGCFAAPQCDTNGPAPLCHAEVLRRSLEAHKCAGPLTRIWPSIAQIFIGLFFIGAGLFKLQNYFLVGDQTLTRHFQFWMDNGWPPSWSIPLFHWSQSHHLLLSAFVIALQIIPGILLVLHWHTRIAAALLLFVQMGIFIGTFHHLGFNEFVGTSLWITLFYLSKPQNPPCHPEEPSPLFALRGCCAAPQCDTRGWASRRATYWWPLLTYLFVALALLQLYNRFVMDDPWLDAVAWQRGHLAADVMSIHPLWKHSVLTIAYTKWGMYLWVASWWIQLACVLGLLTRFRLSFGAILLCLWFLHIWIWMNGITSQGVLWLLATFVWMTEEYERTIPSCPPAPIQSPSSQTLQSPCPVRGL